MTIMMSKYLKRAVSFLLAFVMVFTILPISAFAASPTKRMYGDANGDGTVDVKDVLQYQKYLLGLSVDNFDEKYADVNGDNLVDLKDLLNVKKFLVGWDVVLGPGMVTVSFYDGNRLIDKLQTNPDEPLGTVPDNEKVSRSDAIFLGWFLDPDFKTPFYADNPVEADMNVYAKYSQFDTDTLTLTSFAQLDLSPDASFTVVGSGDLNAITLSPMDGSEPVELNISGSGPYTITAVGGFNKGASYQLTLPEGLNFVNSDGKAMPDTVRTASFTIAMEVVNNVQMSDAVKYVQHANPAQLQNGSTVTISGAAVGDLICFYKTTSPADRDYTSGNAYLDDPETWFKVASVSGDTVTLTELDEADNESMYAIPDNFPVIGQLPTGETGTLTLENDDDGYALDTELYIQMVETADDATMEAALSKLSVGDFISIYVSSETIEAESDIYFGKITAIENGVITYVKSSAQEISESADMFIKPVLDGDDLLSAEAKQQIEETVLAQMSESGFAEEAAYLLANLAVQTDGFQNMDGVQALLTDENGQPLSDEDIALLNLGASFELSDDIELTVEIITSGDQLHFQDKGSIQLAVGVDATFEVEAEDGKVVIDLSASFVQELAIGVTANGSLVKKKILFIPVPIGVKIGASVDLLSYTGIRVDVQGYTVAEEDKSLYDQLMDVAKNPEKLADVLADTGKFGALAEGLKTVGDVFDKIEEYEEKIQQLQDDADAALAYAEDVAMLWEMVGEMNTDNKVSKEEWEQMGQALGKTNVSQDLMDMLGVATETDLNADRYAESLSDLLEKYSEMLEKETDWVTLVEEEICTAEVNILGMVIYVKADFVVRADMNIAMGASLQYEVGKQYNFWFKIGLFKPEAGSTTMDLIDESFAFQFYVMGKLGIKMGVKATAGFAIGSSKLARVGLSLEMGPYVKLYGFFIYQYERWREANTAQYISSKTMAGALYVDFGLYLIVAIDAAALGDLFEVEYTFLDEEFPLLEAGTKKYPYAFHYEPMEGELVVVQDADGDSSNGVTMELPDEYRALSYCNLETGYMGAQAFDWDHYNVTLSNPAFSIDEKGVISVDVPEDTRYMECDMTITYKYGKLAFSTYDMQVVVPLVWTNLSLDEITQYYTASVRIGNDMDGYSIVWSKRVRKNEEFTLPTEEELVKLAGINNAIYSSYSYPDAGKTTSIIANTSFDCTVAYTDYAVTVSGIQNADGSTTSKTFHTTYGKAFDFSSLQGTGTGIPGTEETAKFTKFIGVTTDATITANGQTNTVDLSQPVSGKVAEAILNGQIGATAEYGDDSVLVTYVFYGIEQPNITERIRKGTASNYDIYSLVAEHGMAVKEVSPALGKVTSATTYYVECGEIVGEKYTLSLEENGGNPVEDIIRVGGSIIGNLPVPERNGHTFDGWFADKELTVPFELRLMPSENITAYAKWTANDCQVTFHVNGGNAWEDNQGTKTVTIDAPYGELPVPTRDGHSFQGWYTTQTYDAGTEVTADTLVSATEDHVLYAKWHKLVEITGTFTYTKPETNPVYAKDTQVTILPDETSWPVAPESAPALDPASFTFKFMRQGGNAYEEGYPMDAGTYDVTITRPADDYYAPFSQTVTSILTIDKATRTIEQPQILVTETGYIYMDLRVTDNAIDDLDPKAKISYAVERKDSGVVITGFGGSANASSAAEVVRVTGLSPATEYVVLVSVTGDPNYHDATATGYSAAGITNAAPTDSWKNHMEPFEIVDGVYEYTITTPGQLAYLAYLVNAYDGYYGDLEKGSRLWVTVYYANSKLSEYTFKLGADIDLSAYAWEPIGNNNTNYDWTITLEEDGKSVTYDGYATNYFGGNFSGNGYTISGMYVDGTIAPEAGENSYETIPSCSALFGYVYGDAQITDVKLVNSYVTSNSYPAAVVSQAIGKNPDIRVKIDNCYVEATVFGINTSAAGIVGYATYADVTNCVAKGRVYATGSEGSMGGIVASISGKDGYPIRVYNCVNYAAVSGSHTKMGGIVGSSTWGNIQSCVNYGSILGYQDVGGIVGYVNDSSHLTYGNTVDCVNYGSVTGSSYHIGGIAGYVIVGRIVNSANFGAIKGSSDCVGGITGEHDANKNAKTMNCVNYGTVSGSGKYIGSVIGRNYDNKGKVAPVFYLAYSGAPAAAGTKNGSSNTVDNVTATSFKTPDSTLQSNLNSWSGFEGFGATQWTKDGTGYGYIPESVHKILYKES